MIFETQEQLDAALAKWQKILRLQDWKCKAFIGRQSEIGDNRCGSANITSCSKEALIRLLDPIDYPPDMKFEQDHEQCLVHELLHLPVDILHRAYAKEEDDHIWLAQEQLIDLTADALIALDRRGS